MVIPQTGNRTEVCEWNIWDMVQAKALCFCTKGPKVKSNSNTIVAQPLMKIVTDDAQCAEKREICITDEQLTKYSLLRSSRIFPPMFCSDSPATEQKQPISSVKGNISVVFVKRSAVDYERLSLEANQ
jgi:hypothetical protein